MRTYLLASAVFFVACGWAQINDPDPHIWVTLYVVAGAVFNYLSYAWYGQPRSSAVRMLTILVILGSAIYSARLLEEFADFVEGSDFKSVLWSVLEFEQGREVAGLAILALHNLLLFQIISTGLTITTKEQAKAKTFGAMVASQNIVPALLSIILIVVLSVATYAWIMYQPAMNARYNTEHCNNAFEF
eukprot:m.363663 g.363663  ORF g.363663 m.363663 type:complete len:188 (-) comp23403_c0_seq1:136-699(-)